MKNEIKFITQEHSEIVVKERERVTVVVVISSKNSVKNVMCKVRFVGRGAHAEIIGVVVGRNHDQITFHTEQIHEAPETTSSLLVKSVLDNQAQFFYDGIIRVEKHAQKTDAYQRNENLLISPLSHATSKPTLEILANDVRCTHGATVGSLPKDQLWYLSTRGIARDHAQQLIIEGFLESAISKIPDTMMQENVKKLTWQTL